MCHYFNTLFYDSPYFTFYFILKKKNLSQVSTKLCSYLLEKLNALTKGNWKEPLEVTKSCFFVAVQNGHTASILTLKQSLGNRILSLPTSLK